MTFLLDNNLWKNILKLNTGLKCTCLIFSPHGSLCAIFLSAVFAGKECFLEIVQILAQKNTNGLSITDFVLFQ